MYLKLSECEITNNEDGTKEVKYFKDGYSITLHRCIVDEKNNTVDVLSNPSNELMELLETL